MDQIERAKRNSQIIKLWTQGKTLTNIALSYGLTYQRIHQIILDNPQYIHNANYRSEILKRKRFIKICPNCDEEFYSNSRKIYCSKTCKQEGFRDNRADNANMHYKYVTAMEMRASGKTWVYISGKLGYMSGNSCRVALYKYSKKMGLLFDKKWIANLRR